MNRIKLFICMLFACVSMTAAAVTAQAFSIEYDNITQEYTGAQYQLVVNEQLMDNLPMPPIIFNDRSVVPVREIFEAMGASVKYTGSTQCVEVEYSNTYIRMYINNNMAYINGQRKMIPGNVVPKLITKVGGETKTMVPLRFISETIGMDVVFDGDYNTILVNSPNYYEALRSTPQPTEVPTPEPTQEPSATQKPSATSKPSATKKPVSSGTSGTDDGITGANLETEFVMQGVDVSHWQNDIDWEKAKDEVDFVILSVGYGQDISSQDDKKFKRNADACVKYGIPFGVYIYSYAMSVENSASEAEHVLRIIDGYNLTFPVYYDLEEEKQGELPSETLGQMAKTFCDRVYNAGYEVGIYANTNWWTNILTDPVFDNPLWYKWVAQYNTKCTYTGKYTMWQYSAGGSVSGMDGNIDMNYWYGKKRVIVEQ